MPAVTSAVPPRDPVGPHPRIAAVILAAGQSRRMGRPKSLLPLGPKPVLAHVIDAVLAAELISKIIVVTGHEPARLEPILAGYSDVERVQNEHHERGGMLSSIQAGLAAVDGRADATFIVLGDQPLVRPTTLRTMISAYRARRPRVIVPSYAAQRGHPILLCARGLHQILALPADQTLQAYTKSQIEHTLELTVGDPGVVCDLDTPADYAAALTRFKASPAGPRELHPIDQDDQRSEACPNQPMAPLPTAG
jgi:molybdenum cofactor cytidylyltransferase